MIRVSLIINVVLLLLVGVLFYLHFAGRTKSAGKPPVVNGVVAKGDVADASNRIAYFELDSITNSFSMVEDVKKELSREEEKMSIEMNGWQKRYNDKLAQFQTLAQKQQMTEIESENANREMLQMQETIRNKKQELDQRYQNMYMQKQQSIKNKIEAYLKEYNKTKGYAYIFSNEAGFMYYRDTAYNITADLLKGLNDEYVKGKKKR